MATPVAGALGSGGLAGTGAPGAAYKRVTASTYSGATCGHMNFAELSNNPGAGAAGCDFSALGNLPRGTVIELVGPKATIQTTKSDVGCGGKGLKGTKRGIDLCPDAAAAAGVNGLAVVKYRVIKVGTGDRPGKGPNISLKNIGGTTASSDPLDQIGSGIEKAISGPTEALAAAANLANRALALFYPGAWWRVGKVILGVILLMYGINGLIKAFTGRNPGRGIKKAAGTAVGGIAGGPAGAAIGAAA